MTKPPTKPPTRPTEFCIRLMLAPGSLADKLAQAARRAGGRALGDGRFAFATEPYARIVLEEMAERFGADFFKAVDGDPPPA